MKHIKVIILTLLLIFLFSPSDSINAQMYNSYMSSVTVQNLTEETATVSLTYYYGGDNSNAGDVAETLSDTIGAFEVAEYATLPDDSFEGSLVISSNKPLGAVSILNGDDKGRGMYTGSSSGGTDIVLPFMMNNWGISSWNTFFSVQNVGPSTATVHVNYEHCDPVIDKTLTIEPYAMKIVDQADEPCLSGQGRVITNATLSSDQPIVVVVSQESTVVNSALVSNGYSEGSKTPAIPLVNSNNPDIDGWRTAISIFNLDEVDTTVTLKYVSKEGVECQETRTIEASSSTEFGGNAFILGDPALTCTAEERFIGCAYVIENTANVDLVATVNQDRKTTPSSSLASSYSSFNPEDGTPRIAFPRFVNRFGGAETWDSTFTVMNVGTSPVYVKCEYLNDDYASELGEIEVNGVREDLPRYDLPDNYTGGAICTAYSDAEYSTIDYTAKIIGMVNTRGFGGEGFYDLMMTYEAVNVELNP